MTASELIAECSRRAGVPEVPPSDLAGMRAMVAAVRKAARVSAFVMTWAEAQAELGQHMGVEQFIAARGKERTTYSRRADFRDLFPGVELSEFAWEHFGGVSVPARRDRRASAAPPAVRQARPAGPSSARAGRGEAAPA